MYNSIVKVGDPLFTKTRDIKQVVMDTGNGLFRVWNSTYHSGYWGDPTTQEGWEAAQVYLLNSRGDATWKPWEYIKQQLASLERHLAV